MQTLTFIELCAAFQAKFKTSMDLERPVETALLLSAAGVRSLMLNQWHTTLDNNAKRLGFLAEDLLAVGKTIGQTIHSQRHLGSGLVDLKDEPHAIPEDKEELSDILVLKPPLWDPSVFSFVLYGLPNMIVM
ncbi:hypothetical protein GDO86_013310 [Hymenochirus boettgeri]|uniref:Uncharacterized protein n=1 Tax=Hymenochirus boettgeri TaxID=247094 RepID=A0A8T2IUA4_9PIPI|nr:hypothetical protein GDO86_013310 [Hymenochirus boettgeri]